MPSDTPSPELLVDDSPAARRTSIALAVVAAIALFGNCLLTSPRAFSQAHQQDSSLLKIVVGALALTGPDSSAGAFPTYRGVEIRNLFFFLGAAALALIAAFRLVSTDRRPRATGDDLLDFRRRAASPYFWWLILLLVSVLSSTFSHAPDVCKGQSIMRFLALAWWWPLAALLAPRQVARLSGALVAALGLTAAVGLWYYAERNRPGTALSYPVGNELWFGACLLPGVFVALGLFFATPELRRPTQVQATPPDAAKRGRGGWLRLVALIVALGAILLALILTHSRSAYAGLAAGVFTAVCFVSGKSVRRSVLLVALLCALVGAIWVQSLRTHGVMGERAHSLRVRLNYEWPYALKLFEDKPVAGNGDGSYALLAGQYARDDQIEDPSTISFDEFSWIGRADNEYLQLLAELGVVGFFAFVAALALTLYRALQFCDQHRGDSAASSQRWLAIGLAASLVAVAIEEGGSPALREPGLPPIFLTVWAALWALARGQQRPPEPVIEEKQLGTAALRLSGVAAGICAVILGYYGVQDWLGARAYLEAERAIERRDFRESIQWADLASEQRLDPFWKLIARRQAIRTRALVLEQMLRGSPQPPTERDLDVAGEALSRLERLERTAPRFLGTASFVADIAWLRADAYRRLGQSARERADRMKAVVALMRHRADEPFEPEAVARLWGALNYTTRNWEMLGGRPEELQELPWTAQTIDRMKWLQTLLPREEYQRWFWPIDRLSWLRELLRRGEVPANFIQLFTALQGPPEESNTVMQFLLRAGEAALQSPSSSAWPDPLAPETFRLAALASALAGFPAEATKADELAVQLYEKAGPRLFAAHAAALNEWVMHDFEAAPTGHTQENLRRLAQAQAILGDAIDEKAPLPAPLGRTRLRVLLAAGQEKEAQIQLDRLIPPAVNPTPGAPSKRDQELAGACYDVATALANQPAVTEEAIRWTDRAMDLCPGYPVVLAVELNLQLGKTAQALDAADRLLAAVSPDVRRVVLGGLADIETRYLASPVWTELRKRHDDFPPPPQVGPPEPTTRPLSEAEPTTRPTPDADLAAPASAPAPEPE